MMHCFHFSVLEVNKRTIFKLFTKKHTRRNNPTGAFYSLSVFVELFNHMLKKDLLVAAEAKVIFLKHLLDGLATSKFL